METVETADGMPDSEIDRMTAELEREMQKTGKKKGSAIMKTSSSSHQKSEYEEVFETSEGEITVTVIHDDPEQEVTVTVTQE